MMMRLENLSAKKCVLVLCCHTELKNTIFKEIKLLLRGDTRNVEQWKSRLNNHLTSVLEKELPSLLRSKIPKYLVSLVSIQITKWAIFQKENFGLSYLFSRDFIKASHFTERYIVDRELTAIELVTDTSLDVLVRFKIACIYLLTDEIYEMWDELSLLEKKVVKTIENEMVLLMSNNACLFQSFKFTYDKYRLEKFYSYAFIAALRCGSEAAVMQSWNILFSKEHEYFPNIASEEVESVEEKLLELFSLRSVLRHFSMKPRKESMDNFLRRILAPDEVVEFKRNLMFNMDEFVLLFGSSMYDGKFELIDSFLQWIYKSEYEINSFKTDLAFTVVSNSYIVYVKQGIDHIDQFIEWSIVDKIERKEFRFQLAFVSSTLDFYSQYIVQRITYVIDEFISWCQFSEDDAREFKKKLMFYEVNTIIEYNYLVRNGEYKEIDHILKWSELSGDDLKNFRRKIRKCCENNIFTDSYILEGKPRREISNVVSWIKTSKEELKEFAKEVKASLRSLRDKFGVIFEKGQQKDIEELMKECQLSDKEIKRYKKLFLINKDSVSFLHKLVSDNNWVDITGILSWIGLSHEETPIFKRELFKISGAICFELAIRGKFDDMNVYLTWLEINDIEMNAYVKEMRIRAINFYRLITKNLGKNNKLVKKYLERKMKHRYQFNEFRLAFYTWFNFYWGNGLCLYCEKTGNFVSGKGNRLYCKHCRIERPFNSEINEINKLINQLSWSQNKTFRFLGRS